MNESDRLLLIYRKFVERHYIFGVHRANLEESDIQQPDRIVEQGFHRRKTKKTELGFVAKQEKNVLLDSPSSPVRAS